MAIENKVIKIIKEVADIEEARTITLKHTLDDLGFHRITLNALIEKLEISFEIEIDNNPLFDKDLPKINVQDIVSLVENA